MGEGSKIIYEPKFKAASTAQTPVIPEAPKIAIFFIFKFRGNGGYTSGAPFLFHENFIRKGIHEDDYVI